MHCILGVAGDIVNDRKERRELHVLMVVHSICLENHEYRDRGGVGIEFEELSFPDETFAMLAYGLTLRVSLLQERLIEAVADLTFSHYFLVVGNNLLGDMGVDILSLPFPASQAHDASRIGNEIGLGDIGLNAFRQLIGHCHDVFALVLDRMRQFEHI